MLPHISSDRSQLEHSCRQLARAVGLGPRFVLCRVLGKYLFYADAEDIGITPHLCLDGFWESWITIAVSRLLQPGWCCIDVGAHCGYYTVLMSDAVGPAGRVLALEPNSELIPFIERNLEVNGFLQRATILPKAAADRSGLKVSLAIPPHRSLNATIRPAPTPDCRLLEVETVSLDDAAKDWPRVDLIKIDAEGAEQSIWQGMTRLIEANPALHIIMEFKPWQAADPSRFLKGIRSRGFTLRVITSDGRMASCTPDQLLSEPHAEWMLFLARRSG